MPTTWNPSDAGSNIALTNGNLTAVCSDPTSNRTVRSTTSKTTGKWYFELLYDPVSSSEVNLQALGGIATASADLETALGDAAGGIGIWYSATNITWHIAHFPGGNDIGGPTPVQGDIVRVSLDLNNNFVYFGLNTFKLNGGDPAAGTGGEAIAAGTWYAAASGRIISSTPGQITANFGAASLAFAPPTGYYVWDQVPIQSFTTSITSITRLRKPVGV